LNGRTFIDIYKQNLESDPKTILRTGDILKIGRAPVMIKESSICFRKFKKLKEQSETNAGIGSKGNLLN